MRGKGSAVGAMVGNAFGDDDVGKSVGGIVVGEVVLMVEGRWVSSEADSSVGLPVVVTLANTVGGNVGKLVGDIVVGDVVLLIEGGRLVSSVLVTTRGRVGMDVPLGSWVDEVAGDPVILRDGANVFVEVGREVGNLVGDFVG